MRCLHYSIIGSCHNGMEAAPERLSVYTRMQISEAATGGVLRNFAKLTGKRLCQSLFFNKVAGLRPGLQLC